MQKMLRANKNNLPILELKEKCEKNKKVSYFCKQEATY